MIGVIDCAECKHQLPLKDGWLICCGAFPEGHPMYFDYRNLKERKECNNGIGFEPIDEPENNTTAE